LVEVVEVADDVVLMATKLTEVHFLHSHLLHFRSLLLMVRRID
jgi:hypothetical protein